ncbi:CD3337/EF1877 family mobilome membrane protein [Paenibacillus sp. NPDC056579]|uniref:CD3337/EF1877 family mobilome membrane protein n=1 Tax=Paenibacillus sp. NPDC056579 TaxID=3345871 RepID=UPI00367C535B
MMKRFPSKRYRAKLVLLLSSMLLALGLLLPIAVGYAQSVDEMIPKDSNTTAIYNQFGATQYSFQTVPPDRGVLAIQDKAGDAMTRVLDMYLSGGFVLTVWITTFFNWIAREAFTFSFMYDLIDAVDSMIKSVTGVGNGRIGTGLWGSTLPLLTGILGAYLLFQMVRARFYESMQTVITFVLAFAVIITITSQAGFFMKKAIDIGNELQEVLYTGLAAPTNLSTDSGKGVEAISTQSWNKFVIRPYNMLQFDRSDASLDDTKKVLNTAPYSDDRKKVLASLKRTYPAIETVRFVEQLLLIICNFVFSLFILGFLTFWSLAVIYYRLQMLIHAATMAITLLAALLPGRAAGLHVLRDQFLKLIGSVAMVLLTGFFLDLSLVVGHVAFEIIEKKAGWFVGMVIEAILIFAVFKYREKIGNVFSKAAGALPVLKENKSVMMDALKRNVTRSLYNGAVNYAKKGFGEYFNKQTNDGVPIAFSPTALAQADTSLNDATTASLMLRYQREKQASEQLASDHGGPIQYSPFVHQVNENMRTGAKHPFRGMEKEWKQEKAWLASVKADGGDMKQAILSSGITPDMNDQETATTMYSNENAIRDAGFLMANRPRESMHQIERAGVLNRDNHMEKALNDHTMTRLFDRYRAEQKQAMAVSEATGQPIQPTAFSKQMDERFKAAGLTSNQQINQAMSQRKKRVALSRHFESMPEFTNQKMKVLKANEALSRARGPALDQEVPPIQLIGPVNTDAILSQMKQHLLYVPAPSSSVIEENGGSGNQDKALTFLLDPASQDGSIPSHRSTAMQRKDPTSFSQQQRVLPANVTGKMKPLRRSAAAVQMRMVPRTTIPNPAPAMQNYAIQQHDGWKNNLTLSHETDSTANQEKQQPAQAMGSNLNLQQRIPISTSTIAAGKMNKTHIQELVVSSNPVVMTSKPRTVSRATVTKLASIGSSSNTSSPVPQFTANPAIISTKRPNVPVQNQQQVQTTNTVTTNVLVRGNQQQSRTVTEAGESRTPRKELIISPKPLNATSALRTVSNATVTKLMTTAGTTVNLAAPLSSIPVTTAASEIHVHHQTQITDVGNTNAVVRNHQQQVKRSTGAGESKARVEDVTVSSKPITTTSTSRRIDRVAPSKPVSTQPVVETSTVTYDSPSIVIQKQQVETRKSAKVTSAPVRQMTAEYTVPYRVSFEAKPDISGSVKSMNLPSHLSTAIKEKSSNLNQTYQTDDIRLEIDTKLKTSVVTQRKNPVSQTVSKGLEKELEHFRFMNKAQVADVQEAQVQLRNQIGKRAESARSKRPPSTTKGLT